MRRNALLAILLSAAAPARAVERAGRALPDLRSLRARHDAALGDERLEVLTEAVIALGAHASAVHAAPPQERPARIAAILRAWGREVPSTAPVDALQRLQTDLMAALNALDSEPSVKGVLALFRHTFAETEVLAARGRPRLVEAGGPSVTIQVRGHDAPTAERP